MNALWAKYGCTKCDAYPVLVLTVNFWDPKASFQSDFITKLGVKSPCVPKEDGGVTFNTALKNQNAQGDSYGGTKYLIKPDRTVIGRAPNPPNDQGYIATEQDIINAGIKQHVCSGSDVEAPKVTISAPVTGVALKVGSVFMIKWTATDNVGVISSAIYFSVNDGTSWTKVDSVSGNTGTYNWTVPNSVSKTCKLQIFAYDAAKNKGTATSNTFAIDPSTGIVMNYKFNVPIAEKYTVTVLNILGKTLAEFELKNLEQINQMKLNLPAGIHIVNISKPDKMFVTKTKIVQ